MADNLLSQTVATAREFTRPLRETLFPTPNKKTIEQRLKEAIAKGDKEEVKRLNAEAGTLSAFTGVYTGLPDLAVLGINLGTGSNIKDLRTRILETTGVPTKASDKENELAYNLPDYAAMAIGLGQLLKGGVQGIKNWRNDKKLTEFAKELETASGADTANAFKKFMVNGQGSDNPMVYAALDQMKRNPKYAELFTKLDKAAAEAALKNIKPRPSTQTAEEATTGIVRSVQDKLNNIVKARNEAGDAAFNKAYALAGDRKIVNVDNTLAAIQNLRKQYSAIDSPEASKVLSTLDRLEETFRPTVNVSPTTGTSIVRQGTPNVTIPGRQGFTTVEKIAETTYDAAGMPKTIYRNRPIEIPASTGTTLKGTPDVTVNIPGRQGFIVKQAAEPLSVPQVQQLMHEFGKKIGSEDSIVKGLSQADLDKINKAIFSGLKSDVASSLKTASTADKQALGALESARSQFKNASDSYNKLIAQGIPKFLQGKNVEDISFEDLTKAYKGLNQGQRTLFRDWAGTNRAESLQALDNQVFTDFLSKSYGTLADGTQGYDLAKLAKEWNTLKIKDPNQADMLVQALGTNANEFSSRMKDALVFTRKLNTGGFPADGVNKVDRLAQDVGRAAGIASYSAKQAVDLTYDAFKNIFQKRGLSDDLVAKALLTKEGADFLKQASLSPVSAKTLEALTKVQETMPTSKLYGAFGALTAPITRPSDGVPSDSVDAATGDVFIPEDIYIPPDLTAPQSAPSMKADDVFIPEDLMSQVSYPTEDAMKAAAAGTVDEGLTQQQIMQGVIQDNPGVALNDLLGRLQAGVNYKP